MARAMAGEQIHTVVERRRSPRAPVTVRVTYATVDAMFSEFAQNINAGGIFIETEQLLAIDEQVHLHFSLPGEPDPVKVVGRVAWVSGESDGGTPGMGVEFENLDAAARAKINALVQRLRVERTL